MPKHLVVSNETVVRQVTDFLNSRCEVDRLGDEDVALVLTIGSLIHGVLGLEELYETLTADNISIDSELGTMTGERNKLKAEVIELEKKLGAKQAKAKKAKKKTKPAAVRMHTKQQAAKPKK
jgi:hypothetical protein